jgi:hypothetical protein
MGRPFVIKSVGAENYDAQFAVVESGEAFDGKWKRKCLWVHMWHASEDGARAHAHSLLYPEYG